MTIVYDCVDLLFRPNLLLVMMVVIDIGVVITIVGGIFDFFVTIVIVIVICYSFIDVIVVVSTICI
jgi:hypothetical protein